MPETAAKREPESAPESALPPPCLICHVSGECQHSYSRATEQIIAICGTFVPGGWAHPGDKCVSLIEEVLKEIRPAAVPAPESPQPRRDGHSALRVKDGKLETFDPHPVALEEVAREPDVLGKDSVYMELRRIYCCKGAEFCRPTLQKAWLEIDRLAAIALKEVARPNCDYTGRPCLDASQLCRCEKCQAFALAILRRSGAGEPKGATE